MNKNYTGTFEQYISRVVTRIMQESMAAATKKYPNFPHPEENTGYIPDNVWAELHKNMHDVVMRLISDRDHDNSRSMTTYEKAKLSVIIGKIEQIISSENPGSDALIARRELWREISNLRHEIGSPVTIALGTPDKVINYDFTSKEPRKLADLIHKTDPAYSHATRFNTEMLIKEYGEECRKRGADAERAVNNDIVQKFWQFYSNRPVENILDVMNAARTNEEVGHSYLKKLEIGKLHEVHCNAQTLLIGDPGCSCHHIRALKRRVWNEAIDSCIAVCQRESNGSVESLGMDLKPHAKISAEAWGSTARGIISALRKFLKP